MGMKFLIIGLGSMGKRRIRNLKTIGYQDIVGFDVRIDRREEAKHLYGITTIAELKELSPFDAVIVSTPPDKHSEYIRLAIEEKKPCFVELSLLVQDLPELNKLAQEKDVLVAPSCTFRFHPSIKTIKQIIQSGNYGKITNFTYHSGHFLPDWHPWEKIEDFFVNNSETSGCKEILSVEMHWITDIIGKPKEIFAYQKKTLELGIDTEDTYALNLKFNDFVGVLLIDVVSRFATRSLILNMEKAQIRWNWEDKKVSLYDANDKKWLYYNDPQGCANTGYNTNLIEEMYSQELNSFIDAAKEAKAFPLSLGESIEILNIIENLNKRKIINAVQNRRLR